MKKFQKLFAAIIAAAITASSLPALAYVEWQTDADGDGYKELVFTDSFDSKIDTDNYWSNLRWSWDDSGMAKGANGDNRLDFVNMNVSETGKYKVSFDILPGTNGASVYLLSGWNTGQYRLFDLDAAGNLTTANSQNVIGNGLNTNVWYNVTATCDCDAGTVQLTVKYGDNTITDQARVYKTYSGNQAMNLNYVRFQERIVSGAYANSTYLDNFKLEQIVPAPVLTNASVSFKNEGGTSYTTETVKADAKTVEIDFGTEMDEDTLTANSVYIEKTDGNKVTYTGSYADNVYTMTLSEDLEYGKNYKLVVTETVKSSYGASFDEPIEISFKTQNFELYSFTDTFDAKIDTENYWGNMAWSWDNSGMARGATGENRLDFWNSSALTTGKYKVSFDILPGTNGASVYLFSGWNTGQYRLFDLDAAGNLTTANSQNVIGSGLDTNAWYNVTATCDCDAGTVQLTVKYGDKTITDQARVYKTYANNQAMNLSGIRFQERIVSGAYANSTYLDNFRIEQIVPTPAVTDASVTFKNAGGTSYTTANVQADAKTVEIDFGTEMGEDTLTADSVYIEKTDGNTVTYTGSYADNVYTMTLSEALEDGKDYKLVITQAAKSSYGVSLAEPPVEIPFKTKDFTPFSFTDTFDSDLGNWQQAGWSIVNGQAKGSSAANKLEFANIGSPTTGKYKISFDVKPGPSGVQIYLFTGYNQGQYRLFNMTSAGALTTAVSSNTVASGLTSDAWYNVTAIYDLDAGTVQMTAKCGDNTYADTARRYKDYTQVDAKLYSLRFQPNNSNNDVYVDNFKIEQIVPKPEITSQNLVFETATGETSNITAVSGLTKKLIVSFDTVLNAETVNEDNIYLLDTDTVPNKKVDYEGTLNGNSWVMTFDKVLGQEKNYKLVVTTGVKTGSNIANEADIEIPFTTLGLDVEDEADALPIIDNFNYNAIAEAQTAGWNTYGGTGTITTVASLIDGETTNDGKALAVSYLSTTGDRKLYRSMGSTLNSGKIKVSYSFKPGAGIRTTVSAYYGSLNGGHVYPISYFNDGNLMSGWNGTPSNKPDAIMNSLANADVWYDVEAVFNFDTGRVSTTITDPDGKSYTKEYATTSVAQGFAGISGIMMQQNGNNDGSSAIDNFKVERILDAPAVSDGSITMVMSDGTEVTSFKDVDPAVNTIKIDFGTKISTATITKDTVNLKENGTLVDALMSYSGNVLTLYIDGGLKKSTNYTLYIGSDIENVENVALGENYTLNFNTAAGITTVALNSVTLNGEAVESISELKTDDNIKINLDYVNTTEQDKSIYTLVAYYSENRLVKIDKIVTQIDASVKEKNYALDYKVGDLTGIDTIKIMNWDGFETMHPYTPSKDL